MLSGKIFVPLIRLRNYPRIQEESKWWRVQKRVEECVVLWTKNSGHEELKQMTWPPLPICPLSVPWILGLNEEAKTWPLFLCAPRCCAWAYIPTKSDPLLPAQHEEWTCAKNLFFSRNNDIFSNYEKNAHLSHNFDVTNLKLDTW